MHQVRFPYHLDELHLIHASASQKERELERRSLKEHLKGDLFEIEYGLYDSLTLACKVSADFLYNGIKCRQSAASAACLECGPLSVA